MAIIIVIIIITTFIIINTTTTITIIIIQQLRATYNLEAAIAASESAFAQAAQELACLRKLQLDYPVPRSVGCERSMAY